jgi:hypothetical protein
MERELGRMKRRNRRLLGGILLVAGGLIVPLVFDTTAFRAGAQTAGPAKKMVRANYFMLEDENGKVRVEMGVGKNGPYMGLIDENGKVIWSAIK